MMGWIFAMVLIICITVIVCFAIYDADAIVSIISRFGFREINQRLDRIEKLLREGGKDE